MLFIVDNVLSKTKDYRAVIFGKTCSKTVHESSNHDTYKYTSQYDPL